MKKLLASTAILLATIGAAHATPAFNPVTATVASTVMNSAKSASSAKATGGDAAALNKAQLQAMQEAQGGASGGNSTTTSTDTKVDGSLGLAFSFPPPAIGNGPWGSYAVGWGLFTSTYFEPEIVRENTFANVLGAYVSTDTPNPFLGHILATYMCASDVPAIRTGGAVAYNSVNALAFGLPNLGGCPTPASD